MLRQKGEPRRSVSFLSSPRGNCPFASNLPHPPHRPPQLRGALAVFSSGCKSLLELQGEQVCLCFEKAPAGRWLSSLPPGRRAPGALRSSGRDWTSPRARLRVAAEAASGTPAGVPREIRCERSQQPGSEGTPLLCPVSPPLQAQAWVQDLGRRGCPASAGWRGPVFQDCPGCRRSCPRVAHCARVERQPESGKTGIPQEQPPHRPRELLWANSPLPGTVFAPEDKKEPGSVRPSRWESSPHSELECILPPRAPTGGCDPGRAGMSH